MANITTYLSNIKNAVLGKEVRGSIHDGIKAINDEVEGTTKSQNTLSEQFKNLIINAGNSNAEVAASRGSYDYLPDRLNGFDEQFNTKASKQELEVERNRIDLLSRIESGQTEGNAELLDIRVGADGKTYSNAGNSVREPIRQLCEVSKNLFNIETVQRGKFGAGNTIVENVKYNCSAKIPVNVGDKIYFSNDGESVQARCIMIYSKSNNYLTGYDVTDVNNITIADNQGYIVVSYLAEYSKFQVEKNSVTEYKPYGYILKEDRVEQTIARKSYVDNEVKKLELEINDNNVTKLSSNLFDISKATLNKYFAGGNYNDNTSYNCSAKIPVNVGDKIYFSNDGESVQARFISLLTIAGNYLVGYDVQSVSSITIPSNVGSIIVSYSNKYTKFQIEKDKVTPYKEYNKKYVDTDKIVVDEIKEDIKTKPIVYIPNEICVAVGRTIEIYNRQICINADKFHFKWYCNVGVPLERKFQITGTSSNVGTYDLTLTLYDDDMKQVYQGVTKLKIVNVLSTSKTNLQIGDSLTNTTSTYKPTFNEMKTLSSNKLTFVGTRGTIGGEKHEGRSGWSSANYLSNATYDYESEGVNPFWDGSRFNWNYYKSQTGLNPDSVTIFLGTNGLATDPTPNANNIKQIVDYIRQDDANIPIFVINTIYKSNQNGIGNMMNGADGFATNKGMFKYDEDMKTIKLALKLQELFKDYTNVHLIPLNLLHDDEYNFGKKEVKVNPRSTLNETIPTDAVHPIDGYLQFADVQFSSYCCHLV